MIIYKYQIEAGSTTIRLPQGARFLSVQVQHEDQVSIWFLVDPTKPQEFRVFYPVATGEEFNFPSTYLGTFQLHGGMLVFHLFERTQQ